MRRLTGEWVTKAEEDWNAARSLNRVRKHPVHNAICFHAQQCAEKYLKARLQEAKVPFSKTHNLVFLHGLVLPVEPSWKSMLADLKFLNSFSIDVRYPGKAATQSDAKNAIKSCRSIRKLVRQSFKLPV